MTEFELEIQTIHGIGDSDDVDRLAELVYEIEEIIDPLIGLNDDGSLEVSFCVAGDNAREAAGRGLDALTDALVAARPLRDPTAVEAERGAEVVEGFAVHRASDREIVPAESATAASRARPRTRRLPRRCCSG